MATQTVAVLVDDLDGTPAAETVRLGWNGEWRELDLSKRNLAAISRVLDKYWDVARPVTNGARTRRGNRPKSSPRKTATKRDPKAIRAWANDNGVPIPAKGRIPADVERQYHDATTARR